jgi:competence protein ComEC
MISTSKHNSDFWKINPVGRPALAIGFGLIAGNGFPFDFYLVLCISCCLSILSYGAIIIKLKSFVLRGRIIQSCLLILLSCFIGILSSFLSLPEKKPYFLGSTIHSKQGVFKFLVQTDPSVDSSGICKFSAHLESYLENDTWKKASGKYKCRIQLKQDSFPPTLRSTIYLFGKPNLPGFSAPKDQFDYRSWLINNKFDGTFYSDKYLLIGQKTNASLQKLSSELRTKCLVEFTSSKSMPNEGELAGALLLGDRKGIDPSITKSFIDTGIIHLLAVSGLHVGLVFNVISMVLAVIFRNKKYATVIAILSLLSLWAYSLITGMSASVIRAACMLSMVVIGRGIKRKVPPFNLLAGSACILILIDPSIISDIGFQLSFCAVFGILAANPILTWIKQIPYSLLRLILVSSTISIAAQVATLPVSFFYFGRFPVYFLLSNLLAIPLASGISYVGFAAIVFQQIPIIGDLLVWVTLKGIKLLIAFSGLMASFPNASITFQTLELSTCIFLGYVIFVILLNAYFSLAFAIKSSIVVWILCSLAEITYPVKNSHYILYQFRGNQSMLTLVSNNLTQQSIQFNNHGFQFEQNSDKPKLLNPLLALGNNQFSLLCCTNQFIPSSRPKSEYILLIAATTNPQKFKSWAEITHPNLVLIAPWINGKSKKHIEDYCSSKGLNIWNWHVINKLSI